MSSLVTPFWFKQRQGVAEAVGPELYKLSGPNLREAYVTIRNIEPGKWQGALRFKPDEPDAMIYPEPLDNPTDAWEAAFELFRNQVVV